MPAQFRVHVRRPQVVALESVTSGKYLAIGQGKTTIGGGGKHCEFIVKDVGRYPPPPPLMSRAASYKA